MLRFRAAACLFFSCGDSSVFFRQDESTPSVGRAIKKYAEWHNLAVTGVTEADVAKSDEGLEFWACHQIDMGARSATGQAICRALKHQPNVKEVYKWLTDDLKSRFRMSWSISRSFDSVLKKRVQCIKNVTKQKELGSWKSELQLRMVYCGVEHPEAIRQASNYIAMCRKFPDAFVEFNEWTLAENFLLVEKLSSSTQAEEWKEIAEQCDSSSTVEAEAFELKARRKFAASKGVSLESVSLDDVKNSPQGLQAWAEALISVPGIEEVPGAEASGPKAPKRKAEKAEPGEEEAAKDAKLPKQKAKADPKAKPDPKSKAARNKESQEAKAAEAAAKNLVLLMQRASQLVGRISGDVQRDPDNYVWAKTLLADFDSLEHQLKQALKPDTGDSLVEFVDELKLGILSSTGTKAVKRQFGSRFQPLLLLFTDRCTSLAERSLG